MFTGSIVAGITPFNNEKVDVLAYEKIVEWHIVNGTQAFVACGSTGESSLLTSDEWELVLATAIRVSAGRIPVIAGCGAVSTHETIRLTKRAKELGADAALIVAPFYVKPNPEGIYQHYKQVSETVDIPVILYNNPGRTNVDFSIDTIVRLASLKNVVALKDSNTDVSRVMALRARLPQTFALLSGDDPSAAAYLACGGVGLISVTANAAPALCRRLCDSWTSGDLATFKKTRDELAVINEALSGETNPTPVKYAASVLGLCRNEVRLPLVPVMAQTAQRIDAVLKDKVAKVA